MKALLETLDGFTKTIEVDVLHRRIIFPVQPRISATEVYEEAMEVNAAVIEEMVFELQCRNSDFGYYLEIR